MLPQNDADDTITGTCDQDRDENEILVDSQQAMWQGVVDKDEFEEARNGYASVGDLDPEIVKDVSFFLNRLAIKSHRLLGNFTTNLAEFWMAIRCKFDGGKPQIGVFVVPGTVAAMVELYAKILVQHGLL